MEIARIVINIVSAVAVLLCAVSVFWQEKKVKSSYGECIVPFIRKKSRLFVPVIVVAFAIIALQFFRSFQFYILVVLDAVAVLASFIASKDFVLQKNAGLYENALISDGRIIKKTDVIALPTLEYEESEDFKKEKESDEYASDAYETAMKSLKVVTNSHGTFFVGFATKEERSKAVEIMRTWI